MKLINKPLLLSVIINAFFYQNLFLMEQETKVDRMFKEANASVRQFNRAAAVVAVAVEQATEALEKSQQALGNAESAKRISDELSKSVEKIQEHAATIDVKIKKTFLDLETKFEDLQKKDVYAAIQVELAKIEEMEKRGIFEKEAKIKARASVDAEEAKIKTFIKKIIDDPKRISKIVLTISSMFFIIYSIKQAISLFVNSLTKPRVITEDSSKWFSKKQADVSLAELIFSSEFKKQLLEISLRIKTAKSYKENLPNILVYGVPGTGKTAFVKALADDAKLEYAITSGSEFAKIKDLNIANDELRKLLKWARNSRKGVIIFIDEAESLFLNRKCSKTSKDVQDFINTFLAQVPEKSNKNFMFVFATNNPFMLDEAILDRIGPKLEFVLPEKRERQMILALYLQKFAEENKDAKVFIHSEVIKNLSIYAEKLEGLSPRSIKYVAEEMIVNARRQEYKMLTDNIAQAVLYFAISILEKEYEWKKDRDRWNATLRSIK